ncbi:MAG: DUF2207 domain-containing protein [Propionibacteriaceae bacterium]|jgi:hypothetical protein|nr:DUF2207 domain-containing protein [Propionibacteriaceae bacterium]
MMSGSGGRKICALVAGLALLTGWSTLANAEDVSSSASIVASLSSEGRVDVSSTFVLGSDAPTVLIQELGSVRDSDDQRYQLSYESVSVQLNQQTVADAWRAGDQEISLAVTAGDTVVISYQLSGATWRAADGSTQLTWLAQPVTNLILGEIEGSVAVPLGAVSYDCESGLVDLMSACSSYSAGLHGNSSLAFTQSGLEPGSVIQLDIAFPAGVVTPTEQVSPIWSLNRAFGLGEAQIAALLGVLLLGAIALFVAWRRQLARRFSTRPRQLLTVPTFDNDGHWQIDPQIRAGMVGTLTDNRLDPIDIVASLLDLAVRGHLQLTEISRPGVGLCDWRLSHLTSDDALLDFESDLLDTITDGQTLSAWASQMRLDPSSLQEGISDALLAVGWVDRSPGRISRWVLVAWVGLGLSLLITLALLIWTQFTLAGLALVAVAVVGLALSYQDSPLTIAGARVRSGLDQAAIDLGERPLLTGPVAEQAEPILRLLPYAVVLGHWPDWLERLQDIDTDPATAPVEPLWYQGPEEGQVADLADGLGALITTSTGWLYARDGRSA